MQANGEKRKSKSKQWYRQNAKKSKKSCLMSFDLKGFLISCNFREKEAIREAYVLLNEYGDKLYGSEVPAVHDDPDEEVDIDTELENEKEALKLQSSKKADERRFQAVQTGVKNIVFIRTTLPDPVKLVHAILDDIESSGTHKVRHILRLTPIEMTCKAFEKQISDTLKSLLEPHFLNNDKPPSYVLVSKNHFHNTITKLQLIGILGNLMKDINSYAKVDFKDPDLVISVDVVKDTACCSVLPRYFQFKKYNPGELANSVNKQQGEVKETPEEINAQPINPEPEKVPKDEESVET